MRSTAFALAADAIDFTRVRVRTTHRGADMPAIGIGTFGSDHTSAAEVAGAVREAIALAYRHVDCARVYAVEAEIGEVLDDVLRSGIVRRDELWITSKLWNDMHGRGASDRAGGRRGAREAHWDEQHDDCRARSAPSRLPREAGRERDGPSLSLPATRAFRLLQQLWDHPGRLLAAPVEDPLTNTEMDAIRTIDRNCRLIKGQSSCGRGARGGSRCGTSTE